MASCASSVLRLLDADFRRGLRKDEFRAFETRVTRGGTNESRNRGTCRNHSRTSTAVLSTPTGRCPRRSELGSGCQTQAETEVQNLLVSCFC
jgi:hypothetical protein